MTLIEIRNQQLSIAVTALKVLLELDSRYMSTKLSPHVISQIGAALTFLELTIEGEFD